MHCTLHSVRGTVYTVYTSNVMQVMCYISTVPSIFRINHIMVPGFDSDIEINHNDDIQHATCHNGVVID